MVVEKKCAGLYSGRRGIYAPGLGGVGLGQKVPLARNTTLPLFLLLTVNMIKVGFWRSIHFALVVPGV